MFFLKWIGWKDYEVPKNRNLESVSAKKGRFFSPTPAIPARGTCVGPTRPDTRKKNSLRPACPSSLPRKAKRRRWPCAPLPPLPRQSTGAEGEEAAAAAAQRAPAAERTRTRSGCAWQSSLRSPRGQWGSAHASRPGARHSPAGMADAGVSSSSSTQTPQSRPHGDAAQDPSPKSPATRSTRSRTRGNRGAPIRCSGGAEACARAELERLHTAPVARGGRGSTVTIRVRPPRLSFAPLELQGRERGRGDLAVPLFRAAGQGGETVHSTSAAGPLDPGSSSPCRMPEMEASSCSSRRKKGQRRRGLGRVGGGHHSCLPSPGRAGPPLMATGESSARFE
jgi:hypothetical protein